MWPLCYEYTFVIWSFFSFLLLSLFAWGWGWGWVCERERGCWLGMGMDRGNGMCGWRVAGGGEDQGGDYFVGL